MSQRYSRQRLFPPIGPAGQERLRAARVLIVGCGALGASHAEMLARAGVGRLRIVDRDFVEISNLQRQTLFDESDAKERLPKAVAAGKRIAAINSEIDVETIVADVNHSNIENLIADCDLVLDGSDNFQVRYLLNDACVKHGVPWIYGAAVASYGTTMTVIPGETPCLRCVFDEMPEAGTSPTCDTAGVIMPIIASISAVQVGEAMKILVGDLASLHRSLIQIDIWANDRRAIKLVQRNPDCGTCGTGEFEFLAADNQAATAVLCGRDAVQIMPPTPTHIDLAQLAERLGKIGEVLQNEYLVKFSKDGYEITVFTDARAIIKGTDDIARARSLYAAYVGS